MQVEAGAAEATAALASGGSPVPSLGWNERRVITSVRVGAEIPFRVKYQWRSVFPAQLFSEHKFFKKSPQQRGRMNTEKIKE